MDTSKTILVAEDDEHIAKPLHMYLSDDVIEHLARGMDELQNCWGA